MGVHVSLFLLKDGDAQAFLRAAGLHDGGHEDPEHAGPFSMARLGRHRLIWMNWHDGMPDEKDVQHLSRTAPFLNLDISESSGMSVCRSWQRGDQAWVLAHDRAMPTGSDLGGMDVAGALPPEAQPILDACLQTPGAADAPALHDAPGLLFQALGGIRPDAPPALQFRALRREPPEAKPWWRFWS